MLWEAELFSLNAETSKFTIALFIHVLLTMHIEQEKPIIAFTIHFTALLLCLAANLNTYIKLSEITAASFQHHKQKHCKVKDFTKE